MTWGVERSGLPQAPRPGTTPDPCTWSWWVLLVCSKMRKENWTLLLILSEPLNSMVPALGRPRKMCRLQRNSREQKLPKGQLSSQGLGSQCVTSQTWAYQLAAEAMTRIRGHLSFHLCWRKRLEDRAWLMAQQSLELPMPVREKMRNRSSMRRREKARDFQIRTTKIRREKIPLSPLPRRKSALRRTRRGPSSGLPG